MCIALGLKDREVCNPSRRGDYLKFQLFGKWPDILFNLAIGFDVGFLSQSQVNQGSPGFFET